MLRSANDIIGYVIHATDSNLGNVDDFFFDDEAWVIRYLVVDISHHESGRKTLISPVAMGKPDWEAQTLPVNLTCEQVRNSPDIDTDKPVHRQHEAELHDYYLWPMYWQAGYANAGMYGMIPPALIEEEPLEEPAGVAEKQGDPHLRSVRQVVDYHVQATDGAIGHVEDFIVDDEGWAIRYIVVNTRNWWPGKKVLVSPRWIKEVNWAESKVVIDLAREAIKNSPEYDPSKPITTKYADQLHDHYGRARHPR